MRDPWKGVPRPGFLKDFGNSDGEQDELERSGTRSMVFQEFQGSRRGLSSVRARTRSLVLGSFWGGKCILEVEGSQE